MDDRVHACENCKYRAINKTVDCNNGQCSAFFGVKDTNLRAPNRIDIEFGFLIERLLNELELYSATTGMPVVVMKQQQQQYINIKTICYVQCCYYFDVVISVCMDIDMCGLWMDERNTSSI